MPAHSYMEDNGSAAILVAKRSVGVTLMGLETSTYRATAASQCETSQTFYRRSVSFVLVFFLIKNQDCL